MKNNYVYPTGKNTVYWWGVSDDGIWVGERNYRFEILPTDVTKTGGVVNNKIFV